MIDYFRFGFFCCKNSSNPCISYRNCVWLVCWERSTNPRTSFLWSTELVIFQCTQSAPPPCLPAYNMYIIIYGRSWQYRAYEENLYGYDFLNSAYILYTQAQLWKGWVCHVLVAVPQVSVFTGRTCSACRSVSWALHVKCVWGRRSLAESSNTLQWHVPTVA